MVIKIKKTQLAIMELIHKNKRVDVYSSAIFHCVAEGFPMSGSWIIFPIAP